MKILMIKTGIVLLAMYYCSDRSESYSSNSCAGTANDKNLSCYNLLAQLDLAEIASLCAKHSTSAVLTEEKAAPFKHLSVESNFGRYYLFYKGPSGIKELGEMTVSFKSSPSDWRFFNGDEVVLAIRIKDAAISLGDHIVVGGSLNDVIDYLGEPQFTNGAYVFESDCELVEIVTNVERKIVNYSVMKKA